MIRYLRSKRALIARNNELETIVAKQDAEIAQYEEEIKRAEAVTKIRIDRLQESWRQAIRTTGIEHRLRVAAEEKLVQVVAELHNLRDEIRAEENRGNLPSAAGVGMVRPLAERKPGMARVLDRPMPWQTADAIDQDADAKRQADGAGDPE